MRLMKGTDLARTLGISRRTVLDWAQRWPDLVVYRGERGRRDKRGRFSDGYWFKLELLATKPGMDLITALTLPGQRWMKVVDLAALSGLPRRTLAYWARTRPRFARRLGRIYYVDLNQLEASDEQVEFLRKWAPRAKTELTILETTLGDTSKKPQEEGKVST